jgi:hypothetical protein
MKITVNHFGRVCSNQPSSFESTAPLKNSHSVNKVKSVFSMNNAQIIPLFTRLCEHESKSKGRKSERPVGLPCFLDVLVPFHNSARFHDEATTSDYGSDIGYKFNIASGANEHGHKETGCP